MIRQSIYSLLGLPSEYGVGLLTVATILALSPYLAGADFGIFKIPRLGARTRRALKLLGPVLLLTIGLSFFPFWKIASDSKGESDEPRVATEEVMTPSQDQDLVREELGQEIAAFFSVKVGTAKKLYDLIKRSRRDQGDFVLVRSKKAYFEDCPTFQVTLRNRGELPRIVKGIIVAQHHQAHGERSSDIRMIPKAARWILMLPEQEGAFGYEPDDLLEVPAGQAVTLDIILSSWVPEPLLGLMKPDDETAVLRTFESLWEREIIIVLEGGQALVIK